MINTHFKIKTMKYLKQLLTLLIAVSIFSSCKKDEVKTVPVASLTLVNAVFGGTSAKFGSRDFACPSNFAFPYALNAGSNDLYVWPSNDSLHPYYTYSKLTVADREVYSLFLCGTPTTPEGILLKENIPYHTDSTLGIRFINLAANKPSINITLSATPTVNEVSNLSYKQYTEFKSYAGLYNSSYSFQVRDANNPSTVLTTFSYSISNLPRFANVTLVIRQNGSGVAIFVEKNDR